MMIPTGVRPYWIQSRSRDFVVTCTIDHREFILHKSTDISVVELAQMLRRFDNLDDKHITANFKELKGKSNV